MSVSKNEYDKMAKAASPDSPIVLNCIKAFLFGGGICCFGELLFYLYGLTNLNSDQIKILVPITIIVITAIITAFGVFDNIARHAGAGTIVPITGFANSVVCSAMEFKNQGKIMGVGANIFSIAGPVILFGTAAATVYGVIYWVFLRVL
ncbi:MAG: SpoVA/SpoVAEb family sporulation membrane protein [Clostridia bacterium]|nr:SpoVA/SpoVAEb family sporulation membrane protein [Clostridia bacterium]